MTRPGQLDLDEIVARLSREPRARRVPVGFHGPHSYRGTYSEVAFCVTTDVTVGEMLDAAHSAIGAVYEGWKGGEYRMEGDTPVWLVQDVGDCGETLGAVLLDALLRDDLAQNLTDAAQGAPTPYTGTLDPPTLVTLAKRFARTHQERDAARAREDQLRQQLRDAREQIETLKAQLPTHATDETAPAGNPS